MTIDRNNTNRARERAAACWRAFLHGYRVANKVTHHGLGIALGALVVAYFIFCALFLGLRYAVLPNIDRYKPAVERMASAAVGRQVTIATIHASWHGLRPNLLLGDVAIHNREGQQVLSLPKVSATLSWWSVAVADLRLNSLEISRPDMEIERDRDGNIYVAGILLEREAGGEGKGLDWVLSQREIVIRDGWVRWNDAMRGAPPLVLNKVDFVLQNQWLQHRFALRATPPAELAAPLDVRADFSHPPFAERISDVSQWTGTLYADWRDTDLAAWKKYFDYPVEVFQGKGAVRAWLSFDRASVDDFTADLTLADVSARLHKDLKVLNLVRVAGRISARELSARAKNSLLSFGAGGHVVTLSDFSLETRDGLKLPTTTISQTVIAATRNRPERTEIRASALDLQTLATLVEHLPLPANQRQMLSDLSPRGQLKDFSAGWQGAYPDIAAYSIKGRFSGLSLKAQPARPARAARARESAHAAVPGIPGFANLSGEVDANEKGGSARLASRDLKVDLPGVFPDPVLAFERLNMDARWTVQSALAGSGNETADVPRAGTDQLLFQVASMDFVHDGMEGTLSGTHRIPIGAHQGKRLGEIDLSGKLSEVDVRKIGRYLPTHTPEKLRTWLTGALLDGKARDVTVALKGDLADFPFRTVRPNEKPRGRFSVAGRIEGGKLDYSGGARAKDGKSPLWPVIDAINGSFAIDRARLDIKADSARSSGVALSNVEAVIGDLVAEDNLLEVRGDAAGPLQDFLRFTNDSPVAEWIGHFTEETKGTGNARLLLNLQLPLHRLPESKVQGRLQFAGNDVTLQSILPPMLQTVGELKFHEKGFELNGVRTSFLGGAATVTGGTQRDGTIAVKADGALSADGLRKTYQAPAMQRLLQHVSGGTRYTAYINVKKRRPEITVESGLQGIALDFPAPMGKAAGDSMPLKFEMTDLPSDDALVLRDELRLSLGSAISARYLRAKTIAGDASWKVERGGIGINVPAPLPDAGLVTNVSLASLNIDAWRNSVASIAGGGAPGEAAEPADAQGGALNLAQYIEPEIIAARATELIVMGKKLDNVVVGASHQKGVWQANIDSSQASGYVTWNESRSGRGLGRVTARLASLVIPRSAAGDVSELLEGKNEMTRLPALDIVAENFELFGKKFGQIELDANNAAGPTGREWHINKLNITNRDAVLRASGKWAIRDGENQTDLTYALDISDAGRLLERFGFANVLRGGKGKLDGSVSWKGLPFSLDIPSMSGQLQLDMAAGQFLKVEPGAAKLLGVLSLQSLPRRLALDFRDVFSEGFAFDGVVGTATISQGVIKTDNFKMRGVNAIVLMDGTADIARESQDLHVVVIPEINAGAASVVYGLVVNPVIGLGTFLAQLFLRDPLMKALTLEYHITGSWKDPSINRLERKFGHAPADPSIRSAALNAKGGQSGIRQ